jgi:uncharacterized protein (TIGR02147 family)
MPDKAPLNIYEYLDYRRFLQDFYAKRKEENPSFSYENFARKAGLKSKGMVHDILTGKRPLSKDSLFKVAEALGLDEKSLSYFEHLVGYGQAKTLKEKSFFFRKLKDQSPRTRIQKIRDDCYEFYSQWYYNTLRELLPLIRFTGDHEALGAMLNPPVTAAQARKAVELLLRLGLLEKTRTGFRQIDKLITSGDDVEEMALRDFHLQNMVLASDSIDKVPRAERDHSCLIVGFSKAGFDNLKTEIQAFRKRVLKLSEEDPKPSRVFHVNFLVFPTTRELDVGGRAP